jgi:hypothetical protein
MQLLTMSQQALEPTPKTGAIASDLLNQQVHPAAHHEQGQSKVHKHPPHQHQGQAWFFQAMAHHGFGLFAQTKFVQHGARILGA